MNLKLFTSFCAGAVLLWMLFHTNPKAQWDGMKASDDPIQTIDHSARTWEYKGFFLTAKAEYHVRALVLSKHNFWPISDENKLIPYDLALGWGPMSKAAVLNQLEISQSDRFYFYRWKNPPPIPEGDIISHSANTHIIPADKTITTCLKKVSRYDVVELEGMLVDVVNIKDGSTISTSLTRSDSAAGSCEVLWVNKATIVK